jgi:glutamate racemase
LSVDIANFDLSSQSKSRPESPLAQPIGLYDSGVGGLTVLDALLATSPLESYCYFGDTANMPYGSKSKAELKALVTQILDWLCNTQQVKMVAVACNTTAGMLSDELQALCPVPLVDPISPICGYLTSKKPFQKVGILATPKTVESNRYVDLIEGVTSHIKTRQVACDGLASLVEQGKLGTPECNALFLQYAQPLLDWGAEALILGCTHYPHLIPSVSRLVPKEIALLDPAICMAKAVEEKLTSLGSNMQGSAPKRSSQIHLAVSGNPKAFLETAQCLPLKTQFNLNHIQQVDLEQASQSNQHSQTQGEAVLNG